MYTDKFTTARALIKPEELAGIELTIEGVADLLVHHWPKISQIKTNADEVTISLGIKLNAQGKQTKVQHRISYAETYKDSREDMTEDPDQVQLFNNQPAQAAEPIKQTLQIGNGSMLAVPVGEIIPKRGRGWPRKQTKLIEVTEPAPQAEPEPIDVQVISTTTTVTAPIGPEVISETQSTTTTTPAEADCPL